MNRGSVVLEVSIEGDAVVVSFGGALVGFRLAVVKLSASGVRI